MQINKLLRKQNIIKKNNHSPTNGTNFTVFHWLNIQIDLCKACLHPNTLNLQSAPPQFMDTKHPWTIFQVISISHHVSHLLITSAKVNARQAFSFLQHWISGSIYFWVVWDTAAVPSLVFVAEAINWQSWFASIIIQRTRWEKTPLLFNMMKKCYGVKAPFLTWKLSNPPIAYLLSLLKCTINLSQKLDCSYIWCTMTISIFPSKILLIYHL